MTEWLDRLWHYGGDRWLLLRSAVALGGHTAYEPMVANLPRRTHVAVKDVEIAAEIRVKGIVQGVGFRPMVYQLARSCQLRGEVFNDASGVVIRVAGAAEQLYQFMAQLRPQAPPLANIQAIAGKEIDSTTIAQSTFKITPSRAGHSRTQIAPDTATCPQCLSDTLTPQGRFYRYPFTNCTHCGPRLSIVRSIPYDRAHTSMAAFPMCPACQEEYENPLNRRFHAQPVACHHCGPKVWLERTDGEPLVDSQGQGDAIAIASELLKNGEILAIKGIGGIHLACDATNAAAVQRLRDRKRRYHKPFALMVRDLSVIEPYCHISDRERALLESPAAPIVLLTRKPAAINDGPVDDEALPSIPPCPIRISPVTRPRGSDPPVAIAPAVAPNLASLGVMLPYTPLHHLLLQALDRPIVLTSGNLSDEPQCIDNEEARSRLGSIATYRLLHDRPIVNRVDDSVVRIVAGQHQTLRRARGYAPAPINLPQGFEQAPAVLAMGGELKSTFCLTRQGEAVISQHLGDLENASALAAYQRTLQLYSRLFDHQPEAIAIDLHPDYLSTKLGYDWAESHDLPSYGVQHHHAHIAAAMVEHGLPIHTAPVLGIALDGLGYGDDQTLWGGEFLVADYREFQRVAHLEPIAMLGGAQATRQPWRNTYAQLINAIGWQTLTHEFGDLALIQFLAEQPCSLLNQMLQTGSRSPLASSAGRLFDAVAAAVGICREHASYEGQGAIELEALIDGNCSCDQPYPLTVNMASDRPVLSAKSLWPALLGDLRQGVDSATISARFHMGLAAAIAELAIALAQQHQLNHVVLSGGVFQNQVLLIAVQQRLQEAALTVLIPQSLPCNDGGISLGQAAITAARHQAVVSELH